MDSRPPILHVITGLDAGGAEMMLYKTLARTAQGPFRPHVVSLTTEGPLAEKIRGLGVGVTALGMSRRFPSPLSIFKLSATIRRVRPALIQSWMYHSDLIAGIASLLTKRVPIIWGIHHNKLDSTAKSRTRLIAKACAVLSHALPTRIVCCSVSGRETHERLGYARAKIVVIPNGFDVAVFRPSPDAYRAVREELGLRPDSLLVGLVARYHPEKDHHTFVEAAARIRSFRERLHFILCGQGASRDNQELVDHIAARGLTERFHLLGLQDRMPWLTAALDIACSSSKTEAFANALGEAMAAGVPCVVTNVGDSAYMIGDSGLVVPPSDPVAFAAAVDSLFAASPETRAKLGEKARRRVEELFDLDMIAKRVIALQLEVVSEASE